MVPWQPVVGAQFYQVEIYTRESGRYLALVNTRVNYTFHRLQLEDAMLNRQLFIRIIPLRHRKKGQKVTSIYSENTFFFKNRTRLGPPRVLKVTVKPSH